MITPTGGRSYFRWLQHEGHAGATPLGDVRPPRARHAQRRDYSAEEAEAIFEVAQGRARSGEWRDVLDITLLAVLRFTGARCAEVAGLQVDELDLARRNVSVLGKGSKRRSVPLPRRLVVVLERYLAEVRPLLPASSFLFPALRHGGAPTGRERSISTHFLRQVVVRYGEAAGVGGPHHPHRWRHTYATHLLRSGVDVVVVRDLMGHTSVATTSVYLHLLREDMRDGVEKAFP
ncbi:tyrosine-type recombinase/integrase [Quadrisphaera granulorum]|nr:tyrosine-type recombinase/integrase [Quadrisphaera granulorum]